MNSITGQRFDVYQYITENGTRCMFSEGVAREFGENKMVTITGGTRLMVNVKPLQDSNGLTLIGTLFKNNNTK